MLFNTLTGAIPLQSLALFYANASALQREIIKFFRSILNDFITIIPPPGHAAAAPSTRCYFTRQRPSGAGAAGLQHWLAW